MELWYIEQSLVDRRFQIDTLWWYKLNIQMHYWRVSFKNKRFLTIGGSGTPGWFVGTHLGMFKQGGVKHWMTSASHLLPTGHMELLQTSISYSLTVLLTQLPTYSQSFSVLHSIPIARQGPKPHLAISQTENVKLMNCSKIKKLTWIFNNWRWIKCFIDRNTGWLGEA